MTICREGRFPDKFLGMKYQNMLTTKLNKYKKDYLACQNILIPHINIYLQKNIVDTTMQTLNSTGLYEFIIKSNYSLSVNYYKTVKIIFVFNYT